MLFIQTPFCTMIGQLVIMAYQMMLKKLEKNIVKMYKNRSKYELFYNSKNIKR